jgi:hypothetical protein
MVESVEIGFSRPLALRTSGGRPPRKRQLSPGRQSSQPRIRWFGMFEWSVVVLVETDICRNRRSARGLPNAREKRRAVAGLVGVFEPR